MSVTPDRQIIGMASWLQTVAGKYALGWTQAHLDAAVVDAFGYHAIQLGLPQFDGLRANRMPHRWCVDNASLDGMEGLASPSQTSCSPVVLFSAFDALPFPSACIDLVILPHTLELSRDPHATLAEVERVLVPEGRVVIVGFNPMSLWGMRQWMGHSGRLGHIVHGDMDPEPYASEFLAYRRVRDWLRLLSFEIEGGRFGLWRPHVATQKSLDRLAWMDRLGSHWWPVLGGIYAIDAVKRVRGMRLIGVKAKQSRRVAPAPAMVAQRQRERL